MEGRRHSEEQRPPEPRCSALMTEREAAEVMEIRAFFEARNRSFRILEQAGTWEVLFPVKGYPGTAPYAVGETPVVAARNALALWHDRPDLGGSHVNPSA
jgi:hypothetical protein